MSGDGGKNLSVGPGTVIGGRGNLSLGPGTVIGVKGEEAGEGFVEGDLGGPA
jgi:hypothetical protein